MGEGEIKIKFVKKAELWCLTHWEYLASGKIKQTQEWFHSQEEANIRKKELIQNHEKAKK